MRRVSRRHFLQSGGVALGALPLVRSSEVFAQAADPVFRHGVASGDPLADRVILWTRVTPRSVTGTTSVSWTIARDPKLAQVVGRGETQTGAARDFTVKVDVTGLEPASTYYFRFESAGARSVMGRTRTLPAAGASRVRLGVASCSNLPQGYFNAYACLARRADLDAVLHLGDYIYEYANTEYGDGTAMGRIPAPNKETISLEDYRGRHAQYKRDPDSLEVHRQHPFICVWDDHEFANNSWRGGAENHTPEKEGDWWLRRGAAERAFYEWMPIREDPQTANPRIYRTFSFGNLATLMMLDTRIVGRDQEPKRGDVTTPDRVDRQMLGRAQEEWLAGELAASVRAKAVWNVLGQQVMFAPQSTAGQAPSNGDSWDGYRSCRERVFDMIELTKAGNLAVLTGDVHSSWAYDLPRRPFDGYDKKTGRLSLGVEIVGTSVSSPSNIGAGPDGEQQLADLRAKRPHLHYVDGRYRGYVVLDLTRERLQADYFAVADVHDRSATERFAKGFVTESGRNHLVEIASPAGSTKAPDPAP